MWCKHTQHCWRTPNTVAWICGRTSGSPGVEHCGYWPVVCVRLAAPAHVATARSHAEVLQFQIGGSAVIGYRAWSLLVVLHGVAFWLATCQRPEFGLRLPDAYPAAPAWPVPRAMYICIALAPFVLITVAGLALLSLVPAVFVPALVLVVAVNAAESAGDVAVVMWLIVQPSNTLVQDKGYMERIHAARTGSIRQTWYAGIQSFVV